MTSTPIDSESIHCVVKKMVQERGSDWIPDRVEETIYTNAVMCLLNLLDGALGDLKISFMGHQLKMDIQKLDETDPVDDWASTQAQAIEDDLDYTKLRNGKLVKKTGLGRLFNC